MTEIQPPEALVPEADVLRYNLTWASVPFVKLPGPYPRPTVTGPNISLAASLMRLWAGPNSELTQTLQFHNHHIHYMVQPLSIVGLVFDAIGNADLQHLHILGQAIIQLGETLEYCFPNQLACIPWSGAFVNPGTSLAERLALDIALKQNYIRELNQVMENNPDPLLQPSLRRILEEEELHLRVLQRLVEDFVR